MDKITALYCRFAYDDAEEEIERQKELLLAFAAEQGCENPRFFIDSGVSGLTMDRPAFTQMMAEIEQGHIDTVIVQNLSRICRRASISTQYAEEIFPSLHVRLLCAEQPSGKSLMDVLLSSREEE